MLKLLIQPFQYNYMIKAIWISSIIGVTCAFLSSYLILQGWSLIGDAISHSMILGVSISYIFKLPYILGSFCSSILSILAITYINKITTLKKDSIIGFVYSTFFAIGLLIISINPISIDLQSLIFGNILSIDNYDFIQTEIVIFISLFILWIIKNSLLIILFDEQYARSIGLSIFLLKIIFFSIFSACSVISLQTVGALLVVAIIIIPGATAYLLTDNFSKLLKISMIIGILTNSIGTYISFYLNVATGGIIVTFQTIIFITVFILSSKYGLYSQYKKIN